MTDREPRMSWYLKNRERLSVRRRAYYYANREHIRAIQKANVKLNCPPALIKLCRCLDIPRAEARKILGLPPVRKYTRYEHRKPSDRGED
jgi:hypothetical protein